MSSSLIIIPTLINTAEERRTLLANFTPSVQRLRSDHEPEVLAFLAARPLETVFLRGFILDNGLEGPLNRGTFYGYRDSTGCLTGVALIGHATLFESQSETAIRSFGIQARKHSGIHMIMGERQPVEVFWKALGKTDQAARRRCTELLFEQHLPLPRKEQVSGLRRATLEDLDHVTTVQAEMAFAESRVDPRKIDPVGFMRRCSRRIELNRVWVSIHDNKLAFKADILLETPDIAYLEGVYVAPEHRGNGYGQRCLAQIAQHLSPTIRSLCLFVNKDARDAQEFYRRNGFSLKRVYSTIFLGNS